MVAVIEEKTVRGLREVALLGFFTIALFFLIALITFSNEDAGWSHSGSMSSISNACGVVGAWVADFVLCVFGLMAYLFPIMLVWHGYLIYSQQQQRGKLILAIRWFGFIATIVSGCAIFYLHILRLQVELPGSTGGILGQELGGMFLIVLGNSGATLLFLAIFLAGITLFTGLSWIVLLDFVGRYTLLACNGVYQRSLSIYDIYRDQRIQTQLRTGEKLSSNKKVPAVEKVKITPTLSQIDLSDREYKESQADLFEPDVVVSGECNALFKGKLPTLSLLDKRPISVQGYSSTELEEMSRQVEDVLLDFNVLVEVVAVLPGPVITRFELQLAAGIKVSRVSGLAKDIARGLSVISVRIVDVIQGKSVIGLEIPNQEREMVSFRDLIASNNFEKSKSKLTFAMGKDISGQPVVADLGKMPHVLVAGTTGSGKSVAINTMILSLLYKSTPQDVRMIMIDPKMLELSVYEGIPHLLTPVVTDMKDAQNALRWAVAEMERRYKLMSKLGVRNLTGYNQKITDAETAGEPIRDPLFQLTDPLVEEIPALVSLPSIVIVIDELADMMMIVGKKVEELIARLAQKARAAGIHLVLATQRPSVDVLTGLIKANVPTRISFQVSSRIDSRTILDQGGAEALLGNGDMLFLPSGTSIPIRAHGAFVDDHEVHKIVDFLKKTAPANYLSEITQEHFDAEGSVTGGEQDSETDALYDEVVQFVTETRKASISSVQRRFKVGYNRAARIIEDMEAAGVVSMPEGNGSRTVLAPSASKD
ncbi:MAG: cell division protein FtsK [Methylococcales symbiont of Iophon sp. n. MRB-2018]|nr:MAG: cell division protein FtsK [Methylococcales symbiont of Iophon sp. n. MRB-2018]KAF3979108.1 MAG: cell division protein FtsK [Methylococcales symbiont of Iophon sp. n. MRB-2018]